MKKTLFNFLLIFIVGFTCYISYLTFKSFRYQFLITLDNNSGEFSLSKAQVDDIPSIPNIGITTLPIESLKAKYYIFNGDFSKGIELLKKGSSVNPYIFYSDFLLANYYFQLKEIDSAISYAKKAVYGWPKSLQHYELYSKILAVKKDTLAILDMYDFMNTVFIPNKTHQDIFIDAYSNAKLGYLIFDYPDARSISKNFLFGKWQQMYEFETGEVDFKNNTITIDNNNFTTASNAVYNYKLSNDTLKLYFKSNNKLISSFPVFYSDSLNTLIFKNIPMSVIDDQPKIQDQFFKKIDD